MTRGGNLCCGCKNLDERGTVMNSDTGRDAQEDKQEDQRKGQEQCNAPFLFLLVLLRLDSAPAKLAKVIGKIVTMECIDREC